MDDATKRLLDVVERIEANQARSLALAAEHVELARAQVERAKRQIDESLELQKRALARQRQVTLIAFPGILFCIGAILYLIVRYF